MEVIMKLTLFFGILLSISTAFATTEALIVDVNQNAVLRNSSEHNRMNKKFTVSTDLTGVGANQTNHAGISGSYFLNRNALVMAEINKGSADGRYFFTSDEDDFNINGNSFGLYFKKFNGNSFYFRTGLEYRNVNYEYANYSESYSFSFSGSSLAAAFIIGNQWQWENFTLGCDWVGLGVPVWSTLANEKLSNQLYKGDLGYAQDRYVRATYIHLLRFYVGASF